MRKFLSQLLLIAVISALCAGIELSYAGDDGPLMSVQFENDFFGGGTDRHFSHGSRVEVLTSPVKWIANAADKLPWFRTEPHPPREDELKARASFSVGQNIYTPEDTYRRDLVPNDRPYAGWLYAGLGVVANQGSNRYDKIYLEAGVVGPLSYAQDVQRSWHNLFGLHVPEGWDNQLKNEPGAALYYEQARRLYRKDLFGQETDMIPHFGGSVGNVLTHGAAGLTFRFGSSLREDFGPPRIRPSLPGGTFYRPAKGFKWYLFTGVEGRAVLYNIFLDGNTFTASHSVDRKPLVGDLQAGLVVQWNRFRLSYTQILRTKEFEGQEDPDVFGSLSLSYHF
jgi:lipid A 3-O-deacylase